MEGYTKVDILSYLKELGLVGKLSFRAKLHAKLSAEYVTAKWLGDEIVKESVNTIKHYKVFDNERMLGNRIHALYNKDAREALDAELAGEEPKKAWTEPNKPTTMRGLYSALIKLTHPDKNGDDPELLEFSKRINKAKDSKGDLGFIWDELMAYLGSK